MSRVARWRRAPGDPTTLRGWLFGSGTKIPVPSDPESQQAARRHVTKVLAVLSVYLALAGLIWILKPELVRYLPFLNVGWVLFSVRPFRRPKSEPISLLGADDAFEVRMAVVSRTGEQTGKDFGTLIFCDGWLMFEGGRTDFAVTCGEAAATPTARSVTLTLEDRRTVRLTLLDENCEFRSFSEAFSRWNSQPIPDGEALLPPTETHPEVWVERWTGCILGLIACIAFAGMALAFGFPLGAAFTLLPAGGLVWGARVLSRRLRQELTRVLGAASPLEAWRDRPLLVPDALSSLSEREEDR